jgi:hypothetical protein
MISFEQNEICDCGRLRAKRHCTKCGSASGYALSKQATVQNPDTGILMDVNVYRCRNCNHYYNDLDRANNCRAPERTTVKQAKETEKRTLAEEYMTRVKRGEKLDYIDQLKFRASVGITYDAFVTLTKAAMKTAGIKEPLVVDTQAQEETAEIQIPTDPQIEQMKNQAQQYQSKTDLVKELIESAKKYVPKAPPPNSTEGFK